MINNDHGVVADGAGVGVVHAQDVMTNIDFFLLILVAYTVCHVASQSWTYNLRGLRGIAWGNVAFFRFMAFICDIMMAASLIYYQWNTQNPLPGSDTDWYVSLYAIWVVVQFSKYLWNVAFWEYGTSEIALGFAFVGSLITTLCTLILAILYGVQQQWPAFALSLVTAIAYFVAIFYVGFIFWRRMRGDRPSSLNIQARDRNMLNNQASPAKAFSAPQQSQRQPRRH